MPEKMTKPGWADDDLPPGGCGREELAQLYGWTIEDAIQAGDNWSQESKYAKAPIFRWVAAQNLLRLHEAFKANSNPAIILDALYECAMGDLPMPEWCVFGYLEAFRKVAQCKARSWDDAFGRPHPKGTNLSAEYDRWRSWPAVYQMVQEANRNGQPIDGFLFETIGRKLGIGGKTKVEEIYYSAKRRMDMAKEE